MWWAHCNDCQCQYSIYSTRTVNPFSPPSTRHSPTHSLCLALCGVTMTPPQVGKLTARNKKLLKFLTTVQAIFITIKQKNCGEEEIVIPLLGSVTVQIGLEGERHRDRSWVKLCRKINLIVTINLINYFF